MGATPQFPLELLAADKKFAAIDYIRGLGLPSRFKRKLLQDWGVAVGVDLDATAYELVAQPLPAP